MLKIMGFSKKQGLQRCGAESAGCGEHNFFDQIGLEGLLDKRKQLSKTYWFADRFAGQRFLCRGQPGALAQRQGLQAAASVQRAFVRAEGVAAGQAQAPAQALAFGL